MNNNEWGAEILFPEATDTQWSILRNLGERYSQFHSRTCPPIHVSKSEKRFQFRLGHASAKPTLVIGSGPLSSAECGILRENLVGCADVLHNQMLGIWWMDRKLLWRLDGHFVFVPTFWFPAYSGMKFSVSGLPPEHADFPSKEPSQVRDIYAIASLCFLAISGKEYDLSNPILPGDQLPELNGWDSVLEPALRRAPTRRPTSFQEWMHAKPTVVTPVQKTVVQSLRPAQFPQRSSLHPVPPAQRPQSPPQQPTASQYQNAVQQPGVRPPTQPVSQPRQSDTNESKNRSFLDVVGNCMFILLMVVLILVVVVIGAVVLLNSIDKQGTFHKSIEEKTGVQVPFIPKWEEPNTVEPIQESAGSTPNEVPKTPTQATDGTKEEDKALISPKPVIPSTEPEKTPPVAKPNPFRK